MRLLELSSLSFTKIRGPKVEGAGIVGVKTALSFTGMSASGNFAEVTIPVVDLIRLFGTI